jgi:hypothetical protein
MSVSSVRTRKRAGHTDFLNLVGINVLEQAVLAAGESQSAELRRKLAQLARLAVQHPDAVSQLIEGIEAHHEADQRWQANQKLGKIVEDLVQMRLKSRVGSIEVKQAKTLLAKIEIRRRAATRSA